MYLIGVELVTLERKDSDLDFNLDDSVGVLESRDLPHHHNAKNSRHSEEEAVTNGVSDRGCQTVARATKDQTRARACEGLADPGGIEPVPS